MCVCRGENRDLDPPSSIFNQLVPVGVEEMHCGILQYILGVEGAQKIVFPQLFYFQQPDNFHKSALFT